jgi:hypothetical protein
LAYTTYYLLCESQGFKRRVIKSRPIILGLVFCNQV